MRGAGLAQRDTESRELMDDPDCDLARLERTYGQFTTVNRLVSGWRRIYTKRIRPRLAPDRLTSLLDIGFGGGDIPRRLTSWAKRDGLLLQATAIDPDPRAIDYVRRLPDDGVRYEQASSADLVARGDRYDLVISNHLLHHLDARALSALLGDSLALSRGRVIHNDLSRKYTGYAVYAVAALPFSRGSFVRQDGLLSIRRSYRRHELQEAVPPGWRTEPAFPQRLLLTREGADR